MKNPTVVLDPLDLALVLRQQRFPTVAAAARVLGAKARVTEEEREQQQKLLDALGGTTAALLRNAVVTLDPHAVDSMIFAPEEAVPVAKRSPAPGDTVYLVKAHNGHAVGQVIQLLNDSRCVTVDFPGYYTREVDLPLSHVGLVLPEGGAQVYQLQPGCAEWTAMWQRVVSEEDCAYLGSYPPHLLGEQTDRARVWRHRIRRYRGNFRKLLPNPEDRLITASSGWCPIYWEDLSAVEQGREMVRVAAQRAAVKKLTLPLSGLLDQREPAVVTAVYEKMVIVRVAEAVQQVNPTRIWTKGMPLVVDVVPHRPHTGGG